MLGRSDPDVDLEFGSEVDDVDFIWFVKLDRLDPSCRGPGGSGSIRTAFVTSGPLGVVVWIERGEL